MKGSVDFLKALRLAQGEDLRVTSPAECIALYDQWAPAMRAHDFNPLIPIFGGMSMVGSHAPGLDGLLVGNSWINFCVDAGANTKNAVICLAANYDRYTGMVALALELAMIAHKQGTDEKIKLSDDDYMDVVLQVYGNNFGAVYDLMHEKWNVTMKPGAPLPAALKTRSVWRKELKYDVLIHPVSLEPCRAEDGTPLLYDGTVLVDHKREFSFAQVDDSGKKIKTEGPHSSCFPPVHGAH